MRLFVKYTEKYHKSIIKVSEKYHKSRIFGEKISFSMQHFAIFHVIKIINY